MTPMRDYLRATQDKISNFYARKDKVKFTITSLDFVCMDH